MRSELKSSHGCNLGLCPRQHPNIEWGKTANYRSKSDIRCVASLILRRRNVKHLSESKELLQAVQALNETLQETRQLVHNLDSNVAPAISSTLDQAQKTLVSVEGTLGQDSPLQHEMRQAIKELGEAARAVRILTDYLERHPEALIYGKGKEK